jgi:hypothetical protein
MITYFGSSISPNKVETSEGFLICRNVPIARIGPQEYLAKELSLDGDPNRWVKVNRYEEDVFDKATIASFEGKPVTDTHPSEAVSPDNFSDLAKGHAQNVRREGDYIVADLYINDGSLIDDVQSGRKREVSCGYLCNYEADGADYKQTHIRGNHVAVVAQGRAGHEVAIKDAAAKTAEERTHVMSKFSKAVLTAFGVAAKDAKDDELDALTTLASKALDAEPGEPAEKAQEPKKAEPAKEAAEEVEDEMVEKAPKGDDLGTKLDKLIEMVGALLKGPAHDAEPKAEDEEDEEEVSSEVIEEDEDEEETKDCGAKDCAAFLDAIAPAVRSISDKKERARVSKAILSAVKDADMSAVFKASGAAAQKAADASGKTSMEKICEAQASAYASHNPHVKKEEK